MAVANMVSDNVSILMNLTICCVGNRGNVDYDPSGNVDVSDVTYLVAYLKGLGPEPLCEEEGDVNGSGTINVADLTYLVAYLKGLGAALPACP
ncbi:MAG: dockerin type I repeat-containing protein [Candidatus Zixiibacteriota bacterium]